MFTGIIEEVGVARSVRPGQLSISGEMVLEGMKPGDSIAVNGVCLTVTSIDSHSFSVDVMPETLRRTNLGGLHHGDQVNLERALTMATRMGGHLVQGHIDATGRFLSSMPEGEAILAMYSAPAELRRYLVEKGFIAVDGVSLTIIDCDDASFRVSLVAYTLEHTTLGNKRPGAVVNLEVDIIAKYVERLGGRSSSGITADFLAQQGFLA